MDINMDPIHHAKIVDKLMQYRGKIPKYGQLADKQAEHNAEIIRHQIDNLIVNIEWFAKLYDSGLIR